MKRKADAPKTKRILKTFLAQVATWLLSLVQKLVKKFVRTKTGYSQT